MSTCNHQRRYFNDKCSICGKHIIHLYEHKKNMHDDNGHKRKKITTKKTTPPQPQPQKQEENAKDIQSLIQELEKLRNENEVLRQQIRDLHLLITGKLPSDSAYTIKPPITLVYMSELKKVLEQRSQK